MSLAEAAEGYELHGLEIRSAIRLPEPREKFATADVEVLLGTAATVPTNPPAGRPTTAMSINGRPWYVGSATERGYELRFPEIADFVMDTELSTIECRPDPTMDSELLPLLVSGTVLSYLLALRKECVLHASAVQQDEVTFALTGLSGAGKSTCAALLCSAGARLVTDDVLRVRTSDEPACFRGSSTIRLRPEVAHIQHLFNSVPESAETWDHRISLSPPRSDHVTGLSMIVIPKPGKGLEKLRLSLVSPALAVFMLSAFLRVPLWQEDSIRRSQLAQLADLVRKVPVVEAHIPWNKPFAQGFGESVLTQLTEFARSV